MSNLKVTQYITGERVRLTADLLHPCSTGYDSVMLPKGLHGNILQGEYKGLHWVWWDNNLVYRVPPHIVTPVKPFHPRQIAQEVDCRSRAVAQPGRLFKVDRAADHAHYIAANHTRYPALSGIWRVWRDPVLACWLGARMVAFNDLPERRPETGSWATLEQAAEDIETTGIAPAPYR